MAEKTAVKYGRISNFEGLVTWTLDWVILHIVVHNSSTSTYMPYFIEIEETFCGRSDVHTFVRTYICTYARTNGHLKPALLGWFWKVYLKSTSVILKNQNSETVHLSPVGYNGTELNVTWQRSGTYHLGARHSCVRWNESHFHITKRLENWLQRHSITTTRAITRHTLNHFTAIIGQHVLASVIYVVKLFW